MKYIVVHEPTKTIIDTECHKNLKEIGDNGPDIISKAKNKYNKKNNIKADITEFTIYVPHLELNK